MVYKVNDQITITKVDTVKKVMFMKIDYSKVVSYTSKKHKEVMVNAHMKKLTDYFTLNFQIYGQIAKVEDEGIDL